MSWNQEALRAIALNSGVALWGVDPQALASQAATLGVEERFCQQLRSMRLAQNRDVKA